MQFTDEQAVEVKNWVVKKLEDIERFVAAVAGFSRRGPNSSDADSDVLADYVLALIRTDAPDEEIRKASIENLEDFLKENTVKFVDEIFERYNTKPQNASQQQQPQPLLGQSSFPQSTPFTPAPFQAFPTFPVPSANPDLLLSRKRPFNDSFSPQPDGAGGAHDRHVKIPRGPRASSYTRVASGSSHGNNNNNNNNNNVNADGRGFSPMAPPPGLSMFDPNAAMIALQSMGLPLLPGMPPFPGMPAAGFGRQDGGNAGAGGAPVRQPCHDYETRGFCALGSACPFQHGGNNAGDEYDPTKSAIIPDFSGQRIPSRGSFRGRGSTRGDRGNRGGMRSNRAEFSHIGPNEDRSISTIVVEHIPHEKYNEESVREFFGQFGKIEEVTLRHTRATSNLALVKFDTYDAARAAWASPKVIFDNRFVKVYWFKPRTAEGEQQDMAEQGQRESKPSSESPAPLPFDYEEFQKQQAKAQKIHEERKRNKEEVEGARSDLERMKEDLARKQAEAKAKLMEKIEKSSHAGGAGTEGGGGASQAPTKDAQGDSSKAQSQTQPSDPAPGTTQNENETNVSEKTKALREQLAALEAEAHSFGLDTCPSTSEYDYYPPYRGRGSYRGSFSYRGRGARGAYDPSRGRGGFGRGRGGFIRGRGGAMTLDNRPKRVLVTPVRSEDEEAFKLYLISIGEFTSIDRSKTDSDGVIVTFRERYVAEKLMYGPRDIPSVGTVELSWVTEPAPPHALLSSAPTPTGTVSMAQSPSVSATATAAAHDTDVPMPMAMNEEGYVDYDVAEDNGDWGID